MTTDTELLALARRSNRRIVAFGLFFALIVGAAVTALAVLVGEGRMTERLWWMFGAGALALLASCAAVAWGLRTPAAARSPRIVALLAPQIRRAYSRLMWFMPIALLAQVPVDVAFVYSSLGDAQPENQSLRWVGFGGSMIFALSQGVLLMTLGEFKGPQPALDDELMRMQRDKALKVGFLIALLGVTGAIVLGFYEMRWAVSALPAVILVSLAVASFHYALQDRAASRDE